MFEVWNTVNITLDLISSLFEIWNTVTLHYGIFAIQSLKHDDLRYSEFQTKWLSLQSLKYFDNLLKGLLDLYAI